ASEFENTILGISFIGLANGPAALGQNVAHRVYVAAPMRCVPALLTVSSVQAAPSSERPTVAQSLLPSGGATYPSSETDIFRTSDAMRCFLSGLDDPSCSSRFLVVRLQATAKLIGYWSNRRTAGFTTAELRRRPRGPKSALLRPACH